MLDSGVRSRKELAEIGRFFDGTVDSRIAEIDRCPRCGHVLRLRKRWSDATHKIIGAWLSDRAAYAYLPQSTAYLPPAAELLAQLAKAGFEQLRKTPRLLGAAQIVTGVRT